MWIDESSEVSDLATTESNIRKDLSEWQEIYATLVLGSVKELLYGKEERFRLATALSTYERKYMEELMKKAESKYEEAKKTPIVEKNVTKDRTSTVLSEQDPDTFLLGNLEDSDEAPDDGYGDGSLDDDDFDKLGNSDVEEEKEKKKETNAVVTKKKRKRNAAN